MPKSSQRKHDVRRANRDRRARLEDLRREQRQGERRKNYLFAGSALAVAVVLIAAAVVPGYLHDRAKKAKQKVGYQAAPTSAERKAGCDGVHNDPVSPPANHVPNAPIDYTRQRFGDTRGGTPPIPPSGGPHNPVPLSDKTRFYSLDTKARPERAVHNLEHGYVVAWYDAGLPASQVADLSKLASNPALSELLVVGWWQGSLPNGKHLVLTSWGRSDRCASVSDSVIRAFYSAHVNSPLAPEVGAGAMGADAYPPDTVITAPTATPSTSGSAAGGPASASPSGTPSRK